MQGKGYPDHATRRLLSLLSRSSRVPVFCLVDADPHGLDIASVYKFGSRNVALGMENLAVDRLEWIGVKAFDWNE